jgi:ferrochelatase
MNRPQPFDAVLIIAFGGPEGPDHIRPFLDNVVRGKPVPPERIAQVVRNYETFGGVSPLPAVTRRQAAALRDRLAAAGLDVPVYVGMRNWHPFLADTLADMARAGLGNAVGFIAAAHHSYPSCGQYKENVRDARRSLREANLPDVQVTYVDSWYDHPGFLQAHADHVREALEQLDPARRSVARIVFTAHSIPAPMAAASCYVQQLEATARGIAERLGRPDWTLAYQSRSGRPQDPWLEPDVCDYLQRHREQGLKAAVIAPIGFVIDHVEVLYDLDVRAIGLCRQLGLPVVRAQTLNDDPAFIDTMADLVLRTADRHRRSVPLPIVG